MKIPKNSITSAADLGVELKNGLLCSSKYQMARRGTAPDTEPNLYKAPVPISELQERDMVRSCQIRTKMSKALDVDEFEYTQIIAGKPWGFQLDCKKRFGVTFISLVQGAATVSFDGQDQPSPIYAGDVVVALGRHRSILRGLSQIEPVATFKLEQRNFDKFTKIGGDRSPSIFVVACSTFERQIGGALFAKIPRVLWMRPDLNRSHHFQILLDLLTREIGRRSICSSTFVSSLCKILVIDAIRAYTL